MNSGKRQEYRVGTGATTLLMIFVVLCLTTLGILSLVSARVDMKHTKRNEEMTQAYYEAAAQGQKLIFQVDEALMEFQRRAETNEAYLRLVQENLMLDAEDWAVKDGLISFAISAGADRYLEITLALLPVESRQGRYLLTRHELADRSDWEAEENDFQNLLGEGDL